MWNDLMSMGIPFSEKVIRTVAVYLVLALLLRLAGKRDLAQLNSFDLVVMLLLSNVVQNAVIGPDNSLLGGAVGAAVLVGFNALVVRSAAASPRLYRILDGTPTVLARDGRWVRSGLRHEGLRQADVDAALRRQNANSVEEIDVVTLEPGGAVVASLKQGYQAATKEDVATLLGAVRRVDREQAARIEAKLDELLARGS